MQIINKIFFYFKIILLLIAFSFTLYIAFMKMDYASSNVLTILPIFIPFFLLLFVFVFSLFNNFKNDHFIGNLASVTSFIAIIIISLRTIFDQNIIAYPAIINLSFYNMQEGRIKILLYLVLIGNIGLVCYRKYLKEKIHS